MLIILFAAIIIFLSAKSRFNRAHMEGSSTNYGGGCGGGSGGRGPAGRGVREGVAGAAARSGVGGSAGREGRARVVGARAQTQQLITSNSPTVTKSPARNKNLIC